MGEAAAAYAKSKQKPKPQDPPKKKLSGQERNALKKLRREAKAAGATLETNGEGGLPPSLVLGRMRRDKWRCTNEHCPNPKKNLTVDHISGHPKEIAQDPEARGRKDLKRGIALGHVDNIDATMPCTTGRGRSTRVRSQRRCRGQNEAARFDSMSSSGNLRLRA